MAGLIDNMLDYARGRFGGGFVFERQLDPTLDAAFYHVVAELQTANPGRWIDTELGLSEPVTGDTRRLTQLLSNLLANALVHGTSDAPVRVEARTVGGGLQADRL